MKVGHNSGLLFAANVGNRQHMEYVLTGSTVERTAQAESAAFKGEILVSDETRRLVKDHLQTETLAGRPNFHRVLEIRPAPVPAPVPVWRHIQESLAAVRKSAR